jgi:TatD DNase family protein
MLIDTHAHIDMENYKDNFDEILVEAKNNGVEKIIIPAVEPPTFSNIIKIAEKYDNIYASVGIHPCSAKEYKDELYQEMLELAKHKKVVAIGETGLDYYWDKSFNELQKEVFEKQISLAKKVNKPIIVHDRDAHGDVLEILKRTNAAEPGVIMHCFSGSREFAKECIREGFYIAIGGVVTFKNAKEIKEIAQIVPADKLLLETDSPYLSPEPHRGKENQPAYVKYVAQKIAELRNISLEELAGITSANAIKVFRLDKI